jgi:hypothetical protein
MAKHLDSGIATRREEDLRRKRKHLIFFTDLLVEKNTDKQKLQLMLPGQSTQPSASQEAKVNRN